MRYLRIFPTKTKLNFKLSTGPKISFLSADRDNEKNGSEVFKALFELYGPKIYSFGMSYLKSVHDTEELVQDVFMKLWNQCAYIDESKNVKAFIYKIAVNMIYDQLRKRKLEKLSTELAAYKLNEQDDTTWNSLVFNELQEQIDQLIGQMPDQRRLVFTMSRVEGLSYEEIAGKLNISVRTVENQIYRAMAFLKLHIDSKYILYLVLYYFY
ncbi:ECF RNA polymerase sigma factor SigW [compost metagenome]